MECAKRKMTEIQARRCLHRMRKMKKKIRRPERSYYYCEECDSYHLTKQRVPGGRLTR